MKTVLASPWRKAVGFLVCLMPLAMLGLRALQQDLGANPVEFITNATGDWALRLLLVTLAVTPIRRIFSLPQLARFRGMLGLFSFFYASLHFVMYLWLDKFFDAAEILGDIGKRPFITIGFTSLMLMVPLAVTSTGGWVRRLSAHRWQWLHRLIYLSGIAAVIHYYWLVRSDIRLPAFYGALLVALLASRLFATRTSPLKKATTLKLMKIERQTRDAVTLCFPLPKNARLNAKPGQFLTFDWLIDGTKLPRSYSLSSSPLRTAYIEITVKEQGVVSSFLNRDAHEGLTVEAHGPFGQFYFDENQHRNIVLFAGGSGITPIMSMLRYIEDAAPNTEIMLFYAVRTEHDVIFESDVERLQKRLPRFRCVTIASKPGSEWHGPRGHLDRALIEHHVGQIRNQTFFLCGPPAFMADVKDILLALNVSAEQILQERFTINSPAPSSLDSSTCSVGFSKSGRKYACSSADTLLAIAEWHGINVPSSCRVGQCGTCATRVLAGDVEMEIETGLEPALRAQGYRLLCVGRARGSVTLEA